MYVATVVVVLEAVDEPVAVPVLDEPVAEAFDEEPAAVPDADEPALAVTAPAVEAEPVTLDTAVPTAEMYDA